VILALSASYLDSPPCALKYHYAEADYNRLVMVLDQSIDAA